MSGRFKRVCRAVENLVIPSRLTIRVLEYQVKSARRDKQHAVMAVVKMREELRETTLYLDKRLKKHLCYTRFDIRQLVVPMAPSCWVPVAVVEKEIPELVPYVTQVFTVEKRWVPVRMAGLGESATKMGERERSESEQLLYEAMPMLWAPVASWDCETGCTKEKKKLVEKAIDYFMRHNTYTRQGGNR